MSKQEFKASAKLRSKMTKDGLIEQNAATGEDIRISKREVNHDLRNTKTDQEFSLRNNDKPINRSNKKQVYKQHSESNDIKPEVNDFDSISTTSQDTMPPETAAKDISSRNTLKSNPDDLQHRKNKKLTQSFNDDNNKIPEASKPTEKTSTLNHAHPISDNNSIKPEPDSTTKINKAGKTNKLQFTKDENTTPQIPDKKLLKAERQLETVTKKLEKAQNDLPVKRKLRNSYVADKKTGEVSKKLHFEKTPKLQSQHLKGSFLLRPPKLAANAAIGKFHHKMFQAEHENVGVKAGHRIEMVAEVGIRSALRFHKTAPYRKVARLEYAAQKKSINLSYRRALAENPKLKSNILSRFMQKQKIKREYAKAARLAMKKAKQARKAGSVLSRAAKAIASLIKRNPKLLLICLLIGLILMILVSCFGTAMNVGSSSVSGFLIGSYLAEDEDIDDASIIYTEWETDLKLRIADTENEFPGYDEYRYDIGIISHNPLELMAYLTARHYNFIYADVYDDLVSLFNAQYQLTHIASVEIRVRDVEVEVEVEDEDGNITIETEIVQEEYEWHILTTTLTSNPLTNVILFRLNTDETEHFTVLMETKGGRQYVGNPLGFDWLGFVTFHYGYRILPNSGTKNLHQGVDVSVGQGTPILAAADGVVTFSGYSGSYGNFVIIEHENGVETRYAHCHTLLVSVGQTVSMGDVIATVGNTGNSAGPHLHFEVLRNGRYLNPIFFADTGNLNAFPDFGDPGSPMGDGTLAALLEEAMKHLGKPYVYGASGPNSFDCSGFVSYVLNQSGVRSFPRTNVRGLWAMTNPVSPGNAQPGDLIFFHSTYSTPSPVTHVGIYLGNGQMIHAGKPVNITSINTNYWQNHFFGFGRLS